MTHYYLLCLTVITLARIPAPRLLAATLLSSYKVSCTNITHLAAAKINKMRIARIAFTTPTHPVLTTERVLWDQKVTVSLNILKLALDVLLMSNNVVKPQVAIIFSLLSFELDLNWLQGDMLNRIILTSLEMDISSMLLHCKLIWVALL